MPDLHDFQRDKALHLPYLGAKDFHGSKIWDKMAVIPYLQRHNPLRVKNMKLNWNDKRHDIEDVYERFKKIAKYKTQTKKGHFVRNELEQKVANMIFDMKINYEYEPLVKIGNKYFFPDFLINKNIIIECTAWRGETKAYKLKEKIKYLEKKYKTFVVIPKNLYTYYKILDKHLILGLDEFVPVAQTFLIRKRLKKGAIGRAHGC